MIASSLGFSLTIVWVLVFLLSSFQQQKFSEVLFDQQFASVRRLAAEITGELQGHVEMLTISASLIPDDLSPRTLDDQLPRLAVLQHAFTSGINVIGLDGRVIVDYPAILGRRGMDVSDDDYFQNVVMTGKPAIATVVTEKILQRPALVMAVPVLDNKGKVRAVLAGTIDLSAPDFFGFVFERKLAGKEQFYVTSLHNNLVLASTDPTRVLTTSSAPGQNTVYDGFVAGFEGSTVARNSNGIEMLFSVSSVPMANWLVTAAYPAEVAFQPMIAMRHYLIAMAAILTLLAIFATHWTMRRLLAPLGESGQAMQRMKHGTTSRAPVPLKDTGETSGIINHFNPLVNNRHRSEAELSVSEQRFHALIDNAPDPIFVLIRGYFAYVNAATLRLFGADSKEQLLGQSILTRMHPDMHVSVDESIRSYNETRKVIPAIERKLLQIDGSVVYARLSAMPLIFENQDGSLVFTRDITERKLAERALRKSEERFRRLAALSSEWYWELDENFVLTTLEGWHAKKGSKIPGFRIGKSPREMGLEIDEPLWRAHHARLKARDPFIDFEYRWQEPNGRLAWRSISGEPMFDEDGIFKGYRGTGKDITQRKLAEEALRQSQARIRKLAVHQETIKEKERKRIARDLHDDLGQTLLAIRLDASRMAEQAAAPYHDLHNTAQLMLENIDIAMRSVKSIINDLRPFVLDLGLIAAMEWQVQNFQRWSGIECDLQINNGDFDRNLDETNSTALFRVLQESLTNIARHASASQVQIEVCIEGDLLNMRIADNGIGISINQRNKTNKFGLINIEERINALGGKFSIAGLPGKGTTLTLTIPIAAMHVAG